MPSRNQLLPMVRDGSSYEEIGRRFGIPAGQAYMIVTGLSADGSDVLEADALAGREGLLEGSSQPLANPPTKVPTRDEETEAWLRRRAGADAPMRAAAARRTAAPPEPAWEKETDDVLSVLTRQHNQIRVLQEQLETVPSPRAGGTARHGRQRVSLVDMLRARLSAHEEAEEEHFWPAVARVLPDGAELAERGRGQEQEGKDLLARLSGLRGDEKEFDELVQRLLLALRRHVAFEESVFLRLGTSMPVAEREALGRRVLRAEGAARTRADRPRDAVGHRPGERDGQAEDGGRAAGDQQADVAARPDEGDQEE
ncbi:hemerythrin domain-containing protein [Streptomyces smyrnaeus]|uniref:hemerythrin domain-containing protein n=1 Tax=Streptomyces smyrnaeus TaxID=1387713 RepID=UPI0036ABF7BF